MDILTKIVSIAIGIFVVAIIIPPALVQLADATLTNVSASVILVLQVLLPILAIIAIALYFMPKSKG